MTAVAEPVKRHTVTLIRKLLPLLEPNRYKILYGGRGGVKSWTVARLLLVQAMEKPLRVLCCREVQKSIKDSVHKLLSDQIALLEMEDFYTVLENEIRGANGSSFIFVGLSDVTAASVKSFEGIDRCWSEEAQTISKKSWEILIPTIRKAGSEIWITFNPELDTDETYVRFVQHPPDGAFVCHLTYRDNPWFTKELELERQHAERTLSKEDYEHIWEGKCRQSVAGAIFANEVSEMILSGRLTHIPYDPRMKAHVVCDVGWNDKWALGIFQRGLADVRGIHYQEYQFTRPDQIAAELVEMKLNWGKVFLPWDAFITEKTSGFSTADVFQRFGFQVVKVESPEGAEQLGIQALRFLFPRMYLDQTKCTRLVECFKRWARHVPKHGEPAKPIHDEFSHGCHMAGYMARVVDAMTNENPNQMRPQIPRRSVHDAALGHLG